MDMRILLGIAAVAVFSGGLVVVSSQDNPHGQLAWDCVDCHTTESWKHLRKDMKFDHDKTGFKLTDGHRQAACRSCHTDLVFSHVATACADCHADHHQGRLGFECQNCHTTRDWEPERNMLMQHAERGFPLTGVHAVTDCDACHRGSDQSKFIGTPTECIDCHSADMVNATEPDHSGSFFQGDCRRCHNPALGDWHNADFDHSATFPLTGAHRLVDCQGCHANGYSGTPTDCYSCHQSDFEGASDPDHVASTFSTECQTCHSTIAWEPANIDHNQTAFPLTGAHVLTDCVACHQTTYAGTPTDCFSCHQADYNGTTDPDHAASLFPTDCQTCHSTTAWEPATIDHNQTAFPLTGRHTQADCVACHQTSYTGTPVECMACHQPDYDATTDPSHLAAHFPTTCENCHTASGWTPANWDHDALYFPIYSGAHRGEWNNCNDCHVTAIDYAVFECINCHEHNQNDMDAKHSGESEYQYLSTACYECHPRGTH